MSIILLLCVIKLSRWLNEAGHSWQWNVFSLVCDLKCTVNCPFVLNRFSQYVHVKSNFWLCIVL